MTLCELTFSNTSFIEEAHGWMKLRSSNLANGSSMAGFTQGLNIFSEGGGLGHVTLFKILNPFSISGINEAALFKFGK